MTIPVPSDEAIAELMTSHIHEYRDFPQPGVLFRDITPLLMDAEAMKQTLRYWCSILPQQIDYVVGIEARGFVLGAPLAYELGAGFVPARKGGKLPGTPRSITYELEYGSATVEIAQGAMPKGSRVLVVDDLLATGGTATAAAELIGMFDVELVGVSFLVELQGLGGRDKLGDLPITTVWSIPN